MAVNFPGATEVLKTVPGGARDRANSAPTTERLTADLEKVEARAVQETNASAPVSGASQGQAVELPGADVVQEAVERLNESPLLQQRNLGFEVDEELGKTLISVIDRESEETVRQIPAEEIVEVARKLLEIQETLLGDGKPSLQGSVINLEV